MIIDLFITDKDGNNRRELTAPTVEEVTWTLNQPGGATISVDPLNEQAMRILLNETELQVWMNGSYDQCVVPRSTGGAPEGISFTCEGILSYFEYAYVATTSGALPGNTPLLHWTGQEQFNIAVGLIDWWQSLPNSNRRIDTGGFTASGIYRSRTFYQDSFESVWDALSEFPNLFEGFDFGIKLFGDGRREFWPYYPAKGSFKPQHRLEFDVRGRRYVEKIESWKEDGATVATQVYNTGGTITDESTDPDTQLKIVGHYEDTTASGSPKYGKMTKSISSSQIVDLGWLNDRARQEELLRGQPITTANLAVSESLYGLIEVGDVLPVNIDYGRLRMKGNYRIMEMKWRKSEQNLLLSMQPA